MTRCPKCNNLVFTDSEPGKKVEKRCYRCGWANGRGRSSFIRVGTTLGRKIAVNKLGEAERAQRRDSKALLEALREAKGEEQ